MFITITPIRAGKTVGACVWKISVGLFSFVVMSDFSLNKDLHVDVLPVDKLIGSNGNRMI
jgi:Cft2 family RNA processing exonuclease